MAETFDELVTKHTRRELEEMALSYGVESLGGTKSQLAEAILEARKKQESSSMPAMQEKPQEVKMVKEAKVPKEGMIQPAKKGVMAKIAAISNESSEFQRAGREMQDHVRELRSATDKTSKDMAEAERKMLDEGQQRFNAGQAAYKSSLDAQKMKHNESVANFNSDVKNMSSDFQNTGKSIREEGYRNLQQGLNQFRSDVNSQIDENQKAISSFNSGVRGLQDRTNDYREHDLKNYIQDFYYG